MVILRESLNTMERQVIFMCTELRPKGKKSYLPMPFRNSGTNGADRVFEGSGAAAISAQSRPTAHRLAKHARTGSRSAFDNGRVARHQTRNQLWRSGDNSVFLQPTGGIRLPLGSRLLETLVTR